MSVFIMNGGNESFSLSESEFSTIKSLKPGLKNVSLYGVVVEFIPDPPQSTTEIRNFRYHYRLADSSGSVALAVPHGILLDTATKLSAYLSVTSGSNSSKAEHYLFSKMPLSERDLGPGFAVKHSQLVHSDSQKGHLRTVNSDFDEDSDWTGWSEDEEGNEESIKWLLQPGDLIYIPSAVTTWSHGQMVLVASETQTDTLKKVSKFPTNFTLEPDMSKEFASAKD